MSSKEIADRVVDIHENSVVVLGHCDTVIFWGPRPPLTPLYFDLVPWPEEMRLGKRTNFGHIDLPRLIEGGVSCPVFAMCPTQIYKPERSLMRTIELLDAFYRELGCNSEKVILATRVDDIVKAKEKSKVSAVIAIEGGESIEGNLAALRMLHKLGVRIFGLTHNVRNQIGDGVGERTNSGLTNFGVQLIEELNNLGIVIDLSHLNDEGFWDVIEVSEDPIVATHSNSRAVCNIPRNLSDEQIAAIAKSGGVVGVNFLPESIDPESPTLERVLDHIDHMVELVGPEYVGIGSDFDGMDITPTGLKDVSEIPNLTKGLISRGYGDEDIIKILGGNFLRVFREVFR
jgi:membrane dipeptidase